MCLVYRGTYELEHNKDLSGQSYNDRAATGQGEGVGCGLGLNYALIVAAVYQYTMTQSSTMTPLMFTLSYVNLWMLI